MFLGRKCGGGRLRTLACQSGAGGTAAEEGPFKSSGGATMNGTGHEGKERFTVQKN